jgi:hypothetical protein
MKRLSLKFVARKPAAAYMFPDENARLGDYQAALAAYANSFARKRVR